MKDRLSLDDLNLFLAVCEAGGLAGAALATGQSAPTLSRKMTNLEQTTQRRLFLRGNQGFALTSEGRELREEAQALQALSRRLSRWTNSEEPVRVRITSGTWTSHWLARHIGSIWAPNSGWVPEFLSSNTALDISRREADIGIRNRRPEQSWLAGRRLRQIEFSEYGADPTVNGYVTLAPSLADTPSTRWVHTNKSDATVTTVNDMRLAVDLAIAGLARVVLPTFAADEISGLSRLTGPIDELSHDEWLVTHHEARHDRPVRRAIDALTRFIERGPPQ
ncbi:MAG: LysR family transcriptional regulator [Pseudomonadota bacterium]